MTNTTWNNFYGYRPYSECHRRYLNSEKRKDYVNSYYERFITRISDVINMDGNSRCLDYTMIEEIKMLKQGKIGGVRR